MDHGVKGTTMVLYRPAGTAPAVRTRHLARRAAGPDNGRPSRHRPRSTPRAPVPTGTRQRRQATAAGVAAIVLWSGLAVLTTGTGAVPPFQLLALGFAIGGAVAMLPLLRPGGGGPGALRQPASAFALAAGALFGYHALYFFALKSAPAVEANLLNYLWPLLIVVFAAALPGQRIGRRQLLGAALGLAGAVLIVTRGERLGLEPAFLPGYLAALAAAVTWAGYSVINRRFADVPSAAIAGPCLATAVLGGVAHLLFETTVAPTPGQWLAIVVMGAGPVGAAFWLWDRGTKRGNLGLLGTLAYAAPLLSTAWLVLLGRTAPHWSQAAACALIVAGGLLALTAPRAQPSPATTPPTRT
jgi:drug/metabolite transporter (DMT)-like permease